jgi:hypothetical protein
MYTKPEKNCPARSFLITLLVGVLLVTVVTGTVSGYIITATAGPHGKITPPGQVSVPAGATLIFFPEADPGYHPDSFIVDGKKVPASPQYIFPNVNTDHTISVSFVRDTGSVDVNSNPKHATIFIDGIDVGRTPKIVDNVPVGLRTLKLSLSGYQDYTTMVTVTADTTTTVPTLTLVPQPSPTSLPTTVPTSPATTVPTSIPTTQPTTRPSTTTTTTITTIPTTVQTTVPTTVPITNGTLPAFTILPTPTERTAVPTTIPPTEPTTRPPGTPNLTPATTITPENPGINNSSVIAILPTGITPEATLTTPAGNISGGIPGGGPGPGIPSMFTQSNVFFFLLIMIIPLGLLLSHDYLGLGHLSFPQPLAIRGGVAAGQAVSSLGFLYILETLMASVTPSTNEALLLIILILMLFIAFLTFSAIALAIGSLLSRPLRWTLKVHVIIGVIVLVTAPLIIFLINGGIGRSILVAIGVGTITTLLALWQNHSLALHVRNGRYPWQGFLNGEETTVPAGSDTYRRATTTRPDMFPPELADRYTSVDFLGKGGLSHVFRAMRLKDGKTVAVKIPIRFDETTGKCFMKEIVAWEGLRHPNIVEITEVNILPMPYVEMEYVKSGLADLKKPLPLHRAAEIVLGVADGLAYAHEQGIIHRDIKPQNILITKEGVPKITDWGMSRLIGSSAMPTVAGFSLAYAAPEQVSPGKFGETDERTDIYQLGVVFYELVTGKALFPGEDLAEISNAIVSKAPEPPSRINPEAEPLDRIILRCLQKDPKDRYPSVHALIEDLNPYLKGNDLAIPESEREHSQEGEI